MIRPAFHIFFTAIVFFVTLPSRSQVVICDTMPLAYVSQGLRFSGGFSCADSVITIPIVNNTTTGFAYPLAKIRNTTPLPPGMSLHSSNWQVFASSWNPGDTMPAYICFDVTQPVPVNYTVTFELYVSNFLPLQVDSCVFANVFTINLNPLASAGDGVAMSTGFSFSQDAKNALLVLKNNSGHEMHIRIFSADGKTVSSSSCAPGSSSLSIAGLPPGIYFIGSEEEGCCGKFIVP
ncbi:MAG TPA: hypothetical protein VFU15_01285 [Bacteroidia bacterium]|nr:hypothetical protein [Bacteroidia bacterium]